MKVLHIIPSISPLRGGPSVAVLEMAAAQRHLGIDAAILTTNDHGPGINPEMPLGEWFKQDEVPILAFPRWSPQWGLFREFAISPNLSLWLTSNIGNYQILHVHALFSWPCTTAMAIARRVGVPYVIRTIGQLNHWSLNQKAVRKRIFLHLIERRNLSGAAALHFTTKEEQVQARDLDIATRSWVIPLGVSVHEEHVDSPPRNERPTTFLFLSRIHPKKQLERLIEAFWLLQQRLPEASWLLRIAGNGDPDYLSRLRRQVRTLGLEDRCQWLGFLEGDAKWKALQDADWFVLPSASENFGIAAIEALAAGTPPILSPEVAVAADIAAATAGQVSSSEPKQLVLILETALSGPTPEMRASARTLAATKYSWSAIANQLHQAYLEVVK